MSQARDLQDILALVSKGASLDQSQHNEAKASEKAEGMIFGDQYDEANLGLCLCCAEAAATDVDPDLGQVCGTCRGFLAVVHARLIAVAGINHCSPAVNR